MGEDSLPQNDTHSAIAVGVGQQREEKLQEHMKQIQEETQPCTSERLVDTLEEDEVYAAIEELELFDTDDFTGSDVMPSTASGALSADDYDDEDDTPSTCSSSGHSCGMRQHSSPELLAQEI